MPVFFLETKSLIFVVTRRWRARKRPGSISQARRAHHHLLAGPYSAGPDTAIARADAMTMTPALPDFIQYSSTTMPAQPTAAAITNFLFIAKQ